MATTPAVDTGDPTGQSTSRRSLPPSLTRPSTTTGATSTRVRHAQQPPGAGRRDRPPPAGVHHGCLAQVLRPVWLSSTPTTKIRILVPALQALTYGLPPSWRST